MNSDQITAITVLIKVKQVLLSLAAGVMRFRVPVYSEIPLAILRPRKEASMEGVGPPSLQLFCVPSSTLPYTELFISPSGISELDCATTKTDTAERSISIARESFQVFFCTRGP